MSRQRIGVGAVVFLVAIMCPRPSSADMIDVLWKMSGPQMVSFAQFEFRFPLQPPDRSELEAQCRRLLPPDKQGACNDPSVRSVSFYDVFRPKRPTNGFSATALRSASSENRTTSPGWFVLGIHAFTSTGRQGDDGTPYSPFETWMLSADPMLQGLLYTSKCATWYVAAGTSYQVLFGQHFSTFDKFAFKFRPIGVILGDTIDLAPSVRVYPHGFSADEFGNGPRLHYNRPVEAVIGIDMGISFSKRGSKK